MSLSTTTSDSLSDKCTICYKPPLYTCPRCSARTCSVPCVRLHKTRSLCSGLRDPAAYLKSGQLNTPAAFDHDFNFISGIERRVEAAGRIVKAVEGEDVEGGESRGAGKGRGGMKKGEVQIRRVLEEMGTRVKRAPEGMERRKKNGTGWSAKRKAVNWTVEWVKENGDREYGTVMDTLTVGEGWARYLQGKGRTEKENSKPTAEEDAGDGGEADLEKKKEALEIRFETAGVVIPEEQVPVPKQGPEGFHPANHSDRQPPGTEVHVNDEESPKDGKDVMVEKGLRSENSPESQESLLRFLLHLPTESRGMVKRVLPLGPDQTLREALRGREVLEFPTIELTAKGEDELDTARYSIARLGDARISDGIVMRSFENGYRKRAAEEMEGGREA